MEREFEMEALARSSLRLRGIWLKSKNSMQQSDRSSEVVAPVVSPARPENILQHPAAIRKVAFLGDYLPRKCGIATFTTDLRCAVAAEHPAIQCLVVPVNDLAGGYDYPAEVRFEIAEQDLPSYLRAADFLNITDVDVVCVEHEFGI